MNAMILSVVLSREPDIITLAAELLGYRYSMIRISPSQASRPAPYNRGHADGLVQKRWIIEVRFLASIH